MLGDYDINTAVKRMLSAGRLTESGPLEPGEPLFDAADASGLVKGDVHAGCTLRGNRNLVIEGALLGDEYHPCTVHVNGDVVIRADVGFAMITAQSIRIGGRVCNSRLTATDGIEIGEDLAESRLFVGTVEGRRRQLESLQQKTLRICQERALCEQRLRTEEKRLDKLFKSTRFTCANTLSQIIRQRSDRIQINLVPFYKVAGQRTDDELDQALQHFYSHAVIGRLAMENKMHLKDNPNRQAAFTRVLHEFRGLFEVARRCDRYVHQVEEYAGQIESAVKELTQSVPEIHVRGSLRAELEIELMNGEVNREDGDRLNCVARSARIRLSEPGSKEELLVRQVGLDGQETSQTAMAEKMRGVVICLRDGLLEWPLADSKAAA